MVFHPKLSFKKGLRYKRERENTEEATLLATGESMLLLLGLDDTPMTKCPSSRHSPSAAGKLAVQGQVTL